MKSLLIVNEFVWPENGIGKKICSQLRELQNITGNCKLVRLLTQNGECTRVVGTQIIDRFGNPRQGYIWAQFCYSNLLRYISKEQILFVYIRYTHFANWAFLGFLKKLKSMNVIVVLEIPTYPYDKEEADLFSVSRIKRAIEVVYRKSLRKYVSRVATFSDHKEIYGMRCINISNAVDPSMLPIAPKPTLQREIHFIAVANFGFWHGYDRFIRSLGRYYRHSRDGISPIFHLVGEGPGLQEYKRLAETEGVQRYVHFHGAKNGSELDALFAMSHIGVDSLGRHRSGNASNNSLKSKEYLVRGLPLIKSHADDSIDHTPYYFQVSATDDAFELSPIIKWYMEKNFPRDELRRYSVDRFTWEKQMLKVFNDAVAA